MALVPKPRVVLVPGFTQTASSWSGAAEVVSETCDVRALDVPAPGTFAETARAIGDAGGRALYVGYSMGGRLCLRLALDRPDLVRGLVLVSASPGIADARSAPREQTPTKCSPSAWSETASTRSSRTGSPSRCSRPCRPTHPAWPTAGGSLPRTSPRACACSARA